MLLILPLVHMAVDPLMDHGPSFRILSFSGLLVTSEVDVMVDVDVDGQQVKVNVDIVDVHVYFSLFQSIFQQRIVCCCDDSLGSRISLLDRTELLSSRVSRASRCYSGFLSCEADFHLSPTFGSLEIYEDTCILRCDYGSCTPLSAPAS